MNFAVAQTLHVPATTIKSVPTSAASPAQGISTSRRSLDEAAQLEALLRDCEDLETLSPELLARAIEQNCWYHVTPFRANIIRTLELPACSRILEVGCGAGTLTRFLGEQGHHVVAVETSETLVECARLRCRDLSNVEVIHGFLEDVVFDQKFDFVVCIDPVLVESEFFDPGVQLFAMCKKVLKATGTLIMSVANSLYAPGGAHVEPSRSHVRGTGAPLELIQRSLASAGFCASENYITFPHHAAPQLLVDAQQSKQDRVVWWPLLSDVYRCSEVAEQEMKRWWRGVLAQGLETALAPGWVVLAHAHAVHSVLWSKNAARYFVPQAAGANTGRLITDPGVCVSPIQFAEQSVVETIREAARPDVHAVQDYKESLVSADKRIEQLAFQESIAKEQLKDVQDALVRSEDRHSEELYKEQEALRIREAELGLIVKQYHAVGAMCHDMRDEGRKLKGMLDELRRRYVASEEWGEALAKRLVEAETELQEATSSLPYRMMEKIRAFFSRR